MTYYIYVENNNIIGAGQCKTNAQNIVIEEDIYNNFINHPNYYVFQNGQIVLNPDFEQEEKQRERERINMLSLTSADVERAIYKSRGIDFEDIIFLVENYNKNEQQDPEFTPIDIKALKIELKANNFFRGNPYIEKIGSLLGYSSDDLDYLFENKELPGKEEIEPEPTETQTEREE